MKITTGIKIIAGIFFYGIFVYQMIIAFQTYFKKPTSVTTDMIKFNKLADRPLIVICRSLQFNVSNANELGYSKIDNLLAGLTNKTEISWGKHVNMTFPEVIDHIYGNGTLNANVTDDNGQSLRIKEVYIANIGKCFVIDENNTPLVRIDFDVADLVDGVVEIYVTDPDVQTLYNVGEVYTTGDKIEVNNGTIGMFKAFYVSMIVTRQLSGCFPDKAQRQECMESKAKEDLEKYLDDCLPPWMTNGTQCNSVYNSSNIVEFMQNYTEKDLYDVVTGFQLYLDKCGSVCQKMDLNVKHTQTAEMDDPAVARVDIIFDYEIQVMSQQYSYTVFNLLVEVGSALGLWIGYSAMGLTHIFLEFGADVFKFCMKQKSK